MTETKQHSGDRGEGAQAPIIAFLRDPAAYPHAVESVEVIETHGALVFLAGSEVYKVKKAVRFSYMDFSTLAKRRRACLREVEVNQPMAPMIYRGAVAITRQKNGGLEIGGDGEPVEWAVHMARFAQDQILSHMTRAGPLPDHLADRMADLISAWHRNAQPVSPGDGDKRIAAIVTSLKAIFYGAVETVGRDRAESFGDRLDRQLRCARRCLAARGRSGYVRRCHGDLHLNNIVMIDGEPVLFDAIEFSEKIATIDVLYDLAFLLMDLDRRGQRAIANRVLNRYLQLAGGPEDLEGLIALPLFLGCRAGVRAMVALDRAGQKPGSEREAVHRKARGYLDSACGYLDPAPAVLIAIGGFSGTGKTTLARALAPRVAGVPGALHLRSDVERKVLAGVDELIRLDARHYDRETSAEVYDRLAAKARTALLAGHPVIVDAVFSTEQERAAIAGIARKAGVGFTGLWLSADEARLVTRVDARSGDASDATGAVVRGQIERGSGELSWQVIDAGGSAGDTLSKAADMLGIAE